MFVGEMGCWLVVLGFYIYKRYIAARNPSPLFVGGYQPVANGDNVDAADEDDDDHTPLNLSTSQELAPPAAKPLVPNNDERAELRGWRVVLLAAPACCDITGTTLMNVGLLFVAASIYQMTRGALVLFVGLFSVIFLHRKLYLYQWLALVIVVLGVGLVGLAGAIFSGDKTAAHGPEEGLRVMREITQMVVTTASSPEVVQTIVGVLLIAFAQIFTATQFVLEEWILENYALEPLKVVGWEGLFGFIVTIVGMIILHLAVGQTDKGRYGYFDAKEGWREISTNRAVGISSLLIMVSIGSVYMTSSSALTI